jgi:hypothetical protein
LAQGNISCAYPTTANILAGYAFMRRDLLTLSYFSEKKKDLRTVGHLVTFPVECE